MSDRGGGWVVGQFVLMGLCVAAVIVPPDWPDEARWPLIGVGVFLALAGVAFAVWAGRTLGRAMTPFPRPLDGAPLVVFGPYGIVRHPIYTGGLLLFAGWSLFAGPAALALTVALGVLWSAKAALEERHLRRAHPAYEEYAARVRWRLVPGIV